MKKMKLKRCLAFITAFVLVLSNFSTVAAASAGEAVAEPSVVEVEASAPEDTAEVSVPEEQTEMDSVAETTEELAEPEETTEAVVDAAILESESAEEEVDLPQYVGATATGQVASSFIKNAKLREAVIKAYNEDSNTTTKTAATLTDTDLQAYGGSLNLKDVADVTDLTGLEYAKNASSIDISGTSATAIEENFFNGFKFETFKMPPTVTSIGKNAFQDCANLTEIILPAVLTKLGEYAFAGCKSLAKVSAGNNSDTLPVIKGTEETIGQKVFENCALDKITIPSGTKLSTSMFAGCTKLTYIKIGANITNIADSCFMNAGYEGSGVEVVLDDSAKFEVIEPKAFLGAKFKENSTLDLKNSDGLQKIQSEAFKSTTGLVKIVLPSLADTKSVELEKDAFAKSELLSMGTGTPTYINLPNYISAIGEGCFFGNKKMTKVNIPNKITVLPSYVFDGCEQLSTVEVASNSMITEIGDCAFRGTAIADTDFLKSMPLLTTIGYQKLTQDKIAGLKSNNDIRDKNNLGVLYKYEEVTIDKARQQSVSKENNISSLPLGGAGQVDTTDNNAKMYDGKYCGSEVFSDCPNLAEVTIPGTVTDIGARAFYFREYKVDTGEKNEKNQSVYKFTAPAVTTITWEQGKSRADRNVYLGAFQGNRALTAVTLPYYSGDTLELHAYAFAGDVALNKVTYNGASGTENQLPSSVSLLERGVFFWCQSLPNMTIQTKDDGKCPDIKEKIFEKCIKMTKATVPKEIAAIPNGMFYDVPLTEFHVGDDGGDNSITSIGECAFMGNRIETVDLSKFVQLKTIGGCAYAMGNGLSNPKEKYDESSEKNVTHGGTRIMEKIILPANLGSLHFDTGVFLEQSSFDTMEVVGSSLNASSVIVIPGYADADGSCALFAKTGVTKAVWETHWKAIPEGMFMECDILSGDVCNALPGNGESTVLEEIMMSAFLGANIKSADLSGYTALENLSSGQGLVKGTDMKGAFAKCPLEKVVLPSSSVKILAETFLNAYDFKDDSKLGKAEYNLGGAVEIGQKAFFNNNGFSTITIPEGTEKIEQQAFQKCAQLKTIDFGKVTTIETSAFNLCTQLQLTKTNNFPAELETIGDNAFDMENTKGKLGVATFGSALLSIGKSAFKNSGLSGVEFSSDHDNSLKTIGSSAFEQTDIAQIDLRNTVVEKIEATTFKSCGKLEKAYFGETVMQIDQNALAGCPNFSALAVYDYTTVSQKVFYEKGTATEGATTADNKGNNISITVKPVNENVTIPINGSIMLPYCFSQHIKNSSIPAFNNVLVGKEGDTSKPNYFSLKAMLLGGCYYNKVGVITNTLGHTNESVSESRKENGFGVTDGNGSKNTEVERIELTGMNATSDPVLLKITGSASYFTLQDSTKTITTPSFDVTYKVTVKDVPFRADIFEKDDGTEQVVPGNVVFQNTGTNNKTLYYKIIRDEDPIPDDGIKAPTYNLVIKTSKPEVVYPALKSGDTAEALNEDYAIVKTVLDTAYNPTSLRNQSFILKFVSVGEADIIVYPQGHENWAKVFHYNVNSDLKSITLDIPATYTDANGAKQTTPATKSFKKGDRINVFARCENNFGQISTVASGEEFEKCTNREIEFYLDDKDKGFATVSQDGTLTILGQDSGNRQVVVHAKAMNSDGKTYKSAQKPVTIAAGVPETLDANQVTLFADAARKTEIAAGSVQSIDMANKDKFTKDYYFSVSNAGNPDWKYFNSCDAIITTSDPSILYPAQNANGAEASTYTTSNGANSNGQALPNNQRFTLVARKNGTVTITVCPAKYPSAVKKYTFTVTGSSVVDAAVNVQTKDTATGATVQITKVGTKDNEGEVMYVAPKDGEKSVRIPDTVVINKLKYKVTTVPDAAFKDNMTITSVNIGANVTSIGKSAFAGCKNLTSVAFANNCAVKTISASAFQNCASLTGISIPDTVTKIDTKAFYGCKKLVTVNFGSKSALTQIGNYAFQNCTTLKQFVIPSKVTKIGTGAFSGCKKLANITVQSSKVKTVGKNAFKNIYKKAVIKVPAKKYKKYKKLFKKGQKKTVKIKK